MNKIKPYYINKIPIVQTLTLIKQQERLTGDIARESAESWYSFSEISKGIEIGIQVAIDLISKEPTIESAKVVHGKWIYNVGGRLGESVYYCNKCLEGESEFGTDNYCPNCGAKMVKAKD